MSVWRTDKGRAGPREQGPTSLWSALFRLEQDTPSVPRSMTWQTEGRLCPHAVSNLRNYAWQPVQKRWSSVRAHCPRSHFLRKMAIPDLWFFLTWLFLSQVQMLLSKAEPTLLTGRLRRKLHVPYYWETSVKGSLFTSTKGWAKGKGLHCGKRWTKNLGVWERPRNSHLGRGFNTMRHAPPSVVDGWSELSGLLGAPAFSMRAHFL